MTRTEIVALMCAVLAQSQPSVPAAFLAQKAGDLLTAVERDQANRVETGR